jgi:LacI family transcriptional regulator
LLRSQRVDGVVVRLAQEPPHTDTLLEAIAAASVPCVCIEQPGAERFGFSAITYDDRRGAYDATSYLIAQGHRRIGHIYGDLRYLTARLRLDGYRSALSDHGIHVDDELIAGGTWTAETARTGVAQLFSIARPPTAIFVASDDLAFIVIEELRKREYHIPADVSVIGFDDVELARQKDPPLTTVRIPLIEMGRRAADLVLDAIQAEHDDISMRAVVLPVELVRRGSA